MGCNCSTVQRCLELDNKFVRNKGESFWGIVGVYRSLTSWVELIRGLECQTTKSEFSVAANILHAHRVAFQPVVLNIKIKMFTSTMDEYDFFVAVKSLHAHRVTFEHQIDFVYMMDITMDEYVFFCYFDSNKIRGVV